MECPQLASAWPDYLAGTLGESDRLAVESHLIECASCAERWEGVRTVWDRLGDLPAEVPPDRMRARFEAVLHACEEGSSRGWAEPGRYARTERRVGAWWLSQPVGQVALTVVALVAAFALGIHFGGRVPPDARFQLLEDEVGHLRQLVALSMLEQRSATERLRGVTFSSQLDHPEPEVVSTLLDTLKYDSSPNVRLAVVEVLRQFDDDPVVRGGLVESLRRPQSPMVQISLIDLLVEIGERNSIAVLEQLSRDDMVHAEVRARAVWGLDQLG